MSSTKPAKSQAAKKTSTAKRAPASKAAAEKTSATTAPGRKKPATKAPAKKTPATKASTAKTSATKAPAKKAPAKKATVAEAPATKAPIIMAPVVTPSKKSGRKKAGRKKSDAAFTAPLAPLLHPRAGVSIADVDTRSTPGWDAGRKAAKALTPELGKRLYDLQERLFAEGRSGGTRSVLLVLQGLDTSGKGGIVRHVLGMVDPQGVTIRSFGVPTEEERSHHYLWRIRNALPEAGRIGVFDRSHYEDVLVVKVDGLADAEEIEGRYDEIVDFERELIQAGTTVIKVALVISPAEQHERLSKRLARPDKHWKFAVSDLEARSRWPLYTEAYDRVLERTSIDEAPWHVVPADRKWYARLAVSQLLVEELTRLDLQWPEATFDVAAAVEALEATKDDPTALSPAEVEDRAEHIGG